jgi:hypothetical protein
MVGDSGIAAETSEFQAEECTCAPAEINRFRNFRTRPKRNCSIGNLPEAFGTDLLRWGSTTDRSIAASRQSEEEEVTGAAPGGCISKRVRNNFPKNRHVIPAQAGNQYRSETGFPPARE